jgi:hypothetical protein
MSSGPTIADVVMRSHLEDKKKENVAVVGRGHLAAMPARPHPAAPNHLGHDTGRVRPVTSHQLPHATSPWRTPHHY